MPKELAAADGDEKIEIAVDSAILQHSLDILCILLRTTDPSSEEHLSLLEVFPELLKLSLLSNDIYLLLHATSTMRTFIRLSSNKIKEMGITEEILKLARKMLKPETNEATAVFLGNFIIQIF